VKALVIDDNQSVRTFVERVLEEAGYEVTTAKGGVHAQLLVLRYGPPDLVVTDESMPRMSGHEFAHWVRGNFPGVKMLFLTGYAEQLQRTAGADLWECVGYLEKPCSVRGLLQAVSLLMFKALEAPSTSRQPTAP